MFVVGLWLAYGSWSTAARYPSAAIICGSLIGVSFLGSVILLTAGLCFGGAWRAYPEGLSWSFVQKLEMVQPFFNAAIFSQYTRLIGCAESTPAWATIYLTCAVNSQTSSQLDPIHSFVVRMVVPAHHIAVVAYNAWTDPIWSSDPDDGGRYRITEYVFVAWLIVIVYLVNYVISARKAEVIRLRDIQVHAQAVLQRDITLALVSNFLPPTVLLHVQERSLTDDSALMAWRFDPGCVLQSDIVGFTSLGSRISPEELCG